MDYVERPQSEQLSDIHIYVVPIDLWRDQLNSVANQIVHDSVSAGFIRVFPESTLHDLRQEIFEQLSNVTYIPHDYVFLRSVGRCLTRVQSKQEFRLKAKNYLPPQASSPELFILEGTHQDLGRHSSRFDRSFQNSSDTIRSFQSDKSQFSPHHRVPPIQDESRQPLSASPPNNNSHLMEENGDHGDQGPPLSATPAAVEQLESKNSNDNSQDSGVHEQKQDRFCKFYFYIPDIEDRWENENDRMKDRLDEEGRDLTPPESEDEDDEAARLEEEARLAEEEEARLAKEKAARLAREEEDRLAKEKAARLAEEAARLSEEQTEEKEEILSKLEEARTEREITQQERENLVKRAKELQSKVEQQRIIARDAWKKKYYEEKKKTAPLEEESQKMQQELENLHKKLMSHLESSREPVHKKNDSRPSKQNNLKMQATAIKHDLEDLTRRMENVKMKLTAEMKLKNQAETELRALRAELTQKKIKRNITRSQKLQESGIIHTARRFPATAR